MLAAYRRLLAVPHVPYTVVTALLSRLPIGFEGFAIVLLVREATGSFAAAGVTAACFAAGAAASAAVVGRIVDRIGQTPVLLATGIGSGVVLCALAAAGALGAPLPALIALAAGAGLLAPPTSACLRAAWPQALPPSVSVESAYALESVAQELIWVVGPLLAAGLIALIDPAAAVLASGVLTLFGTVAFAASPISRGWRPDRRARRPRAGALASPAIRTLAASSAALAGAFTAMEVAMPAFTEEQGAGTAVAGVMLAVVAVASMTGGLWYGSREWRRPLAERYLLLTVAFAALMVPVALAVDLATMAVAMVVCGLSVAPLISCIYGLVGALAPAGSITEAFSWLNLGFVAGGAAGSGLAGAVVEAWGARAGLVLVVAIAALAPALALLGRRSLRPAGRRIAAAEEDYDRPVSRRAEEGAGWTSGGSPTRPSR